MSYVLQIITVAGDPVSPFDGQYVQEYDPSRNGLDPNGRPMVAHLLTTTDRSLAIQFDTPLEAVMFWKQIDPRNPTRPDGKPNRPLNAFSVTVTNVDTVTG